MPLLGNYDVFNANVGNAVSGVTDPTIWRKGSNLMKCFLPDDIFGVPVTTRARNAMPEGAGGQEAWILPIKAGNISSKRDNVISFDGDDSLAVRGLPASGSTTITFTPTATGGLIVSGSGSASITLDATGTILSIAAGSGSAAITLSGSALIGALAGIAGTGTITLTPTATIKAIGYLAGLSTNETEFSAAALASAVWQAVATDYNDAGSMGEKLNDAGGAGNPWGSDIASNNLAGTFGAELQKIRRIIANRLTKSGEVLTIYADDGTTPLYTITPFNDSERGEAEE
jgi:hypothetical protein